MLGRDLARVARRFADQTSDRIADTPTSQFFGTVTSVSPLRVSWRGSEQDVVAHGAAYTPGIGDRVACMLIDAQVFVVDRSV